MRRAALADPIDDKRRRHDAARDARHLIVQQPGLSGHWLWQSKLKMTSGSGYAYLNREGKSYLVARLLYEDEYELLPARLRRTCDEPRCMKPDHWG